MAKSKGPKGMHCIRYKTTSKGRRCAKYAKQEVNVVAVKRKCVRWGRGKSGKKVCRKYAYKGSTGRQKWQKCAKVNVESPNEGQSIVCGVEESDLLERKADNRR